MTHAKTNTAKARRALLAKVHIAKVEMGYDDTLYREILRDEYGVESSGALSVRELESLVKRFVDKGWRSKDKGKRTKDNQPDQWQAKGPEAQAEKLKERIGQEILDSELTEQRMRGLIRKICGVDDLRWCGDAVRLRQVLAIIGRMKDAGEI